MNIRTIETKSNQIFNVGKLTVLVGPDNTGKSQFLRDISLVMENGPDVNTTIIKDIKFDTISSFEEFTNGITTYDNPTGSRQIICEGVASNLREGYQNSINKDDVVNWLKTDVKYVLGALGKLKVAFLYPET
jgi:predicted ATP-dependent endonuclease of OLD family